MSRLTASPLYVHTFLHSTSVADHRFSALCLYTFCILAHPFSVLHRGPKQSVSLKFGGVQYLNVDEAKKAAEKWVKKEKSRSL